MEENMKLVEETVKFSGGISVKNNDNDSEADADSLQHDDDDDVVVDDDDSDDGEISAYLLQKNNILTLEIKDYDQTLDFLETLMPTAEKGPKRDYYFLLRACSSIRFASKDLSDESSSVFGDAFNLMIIKFRTQVEDQLNYICNNVSDPTIKKVCSEHLVGFKAAGHRRQMLPSQILDSSLDYAGGKSMSSQSEMTTTEKKSKSCSGEGESGSGGCKSQIDIPENHEAKEEIAYIGDYYHDHSKCIQEWEERRFPRVIQIGKWDPDCQGQGISLLDPSDLHSYSEDELDLANMFEGGPQFRPEDELDHAYE